MTKELYCFQCEQMAISKKCTNSLEKCCVKLYSFEFKDKIMGALIGLARATVGNEHLVNKDTNKLVLEILFTTINNVNFDNEKFLSLMNKIENEKKRLVPSCFYCACSCGRNDDYDMSKLWEADDNVRSLKSLILFGIRDLASRTYHASLRGYEDENIYKFFFKALFAIGMDDWNENELLPIIKEIDEMNQKSFVLLNKAYLTK